MMAREYRGRLAPSPTGNLHLGIARTSLCAWLRARQAGGRLVLRIEDIDGPRVVAGAVQSIIEDLRWLGLDWDEGPDCGGPFAPYVQSQRSRSYAQALEVLSARDLVYPCTCSRKEIAEIASAPHGDLGALYPGTCRNGARPSTRNPALRFRMGAISPAFEDELHGAYTEGSADDFVLRRGDGVYAYQLAVVVDDIAMNISEVVRGDDLLSSTPRQIALYRALGAEPPRFLHVPLLLTAQGKRLAKRHDARSIQEYRALGLTAGQIIGILAQSLGLSESAEPTTAQALLPRFDLQRLQRTAARIDPDISALVHE
jgi:glutamyl-tRNA synthetase